MTIYEAGNLCQLSIHNDIFAATTTQAGNDKIADYTKIVLPTQTHSTNVAWVSDNITKYDNTDSLITTRSDIALGVRTADCVPILIYASDLKAIAAIHAGWKGTLHGIIDNTIYQLIEAGAKPANIFACFGPAICPQCFEVDTTLAKEFINAGLKEHIITDITLDPLTGIPFRLKKPHIDLIGINNQKLLNHNIPQRNINIPNLCTRHHTTNNHFSFHSWRRENQTPHRNITFIKIKT